jgi:hypothetical protein
MPRRMARSQALKRLRVDTASPKLLCSYLLEAWCSGLTCSPVKAETAGSNPVASAHTSSRLTIPSLPRRMAAVPAVEITPRPFHCGNVASIGYLGRRAGRLQHLSRISARGAERQRNCRKMLRPVYPSFLQPSVEVVQPHPDRSGAERVTRVGSVENAHSVPRESHSAAWEHVDSVAVPLTQLGRFGQSRVKYPAFMVVDLSSPDYMGWIVTLP